MPSFTLKNASKLTVITLLFAVIPLGVYLAQREQKVETQAQSTESQQPARRQLAQAQPGAQNPAVQPAQKGPKLRDPQSCPGFSLNLRQQLPGQKPGDPQPSPVEIPNPLCLSGISGVRSVILLVVQLLLIASAIISFFMILWGGIQYILSSGDPKGTGAARTRITFAILGLAISFFALVIFTFLGQSLGFSNLLRRTPSVQEQLRDELRQIYNTIQRQCDDEAEKSPSAFDYNQCYKTKCDSRFGTNTRDSVDCQTVLKGEELQDAVRKEAARIINTCQERIELKSRTDYNQCLRNECNRLYKNNPKSNVHCQSLVGL